jgi:hypothetical protein
MATSAPEDSSWAARTATRSSRVVARGFSANAWTSRSSTSTVIAAMSPKYGATATASGAAPSSSVAWSSYRVGSSPCARRVPKSPSDRLPVGAGSDADDLEVRASSDPLGDVVDVAGRADDPDPGHGRPSLTGVKPFPDATAPTAAVDTRRRCQSRSNGGSTG